MNKKMLAALIILLSTALILVYNSTGARSSSVEVNLILTTFTALKSIVFLGFIVLGVVIGLLLK